MPDPAIQDFFRDRKEAWLKKEIKASMPEEVVRAKEIESEERFSYENWLPDAAKRAGQISMSTHPCTFSHPSARKNKKEYATPVIASAERQSDGFLRTGNVEVERDALGNAAALDVYKFLTLLMQDKKTLIKHIQQETELARQLLSVGGKYEELRDGFLAMIHSGGAPVTSSKIKQVFFPVDSNYHLLSVLSHSGILYELRKRLDDIRFSEKTKQLRLLKKNGQFSAEGYAEIYGLTTIGFGGTKPQNISVLNNQNAGKAHLLLSIPPQLKQRDVSFPKQDFFKESIRYWDGAEAFKKLHGIFQSGSNNLIPRKNLKSGRDNRIEELLDLVIKKMWVLRTVSAEQYYPKISRLSAHQTVWLLNDKASQQHREENEDWLAQLIGDISKWILAGYKQINKKNKPVPLGEEEKKFIRQLLEQDRETLR